MLRTPCCASAVNRANRNVCPACQLGLGGPQVPLGKRNLRQRAGGRSEMSTTWLAEASVLPRGRSVRVIGAWAATPPAATASSIGLGVRSSAAGIVRVVETLATVVGTAREPGCAVTDGATPRVELPRIWKLPLGGV
jgi:hypothetical protein